MINEAEYTKRKIDRKIEVAKTRAAESQAALIDKAKDRPQFLKPRDAELVAIYANQLTVWTMIEEAEDRIDATRRCAERYQMVALQQPGDEWIDGFLEDAAGCLNIDRNPFRDQTED